MSYCLHGSELGRNFCIYCQIERERSERYEELRKAARLVRRCDTCGSQAFVGDDRRSVCCAACGQLQ